MGKITPSLVEPTYRNELPNGAAIAERIVHSRKYSFSKEETEQIIAGYCDERLTVYQLAERYGCHRNTISRLLKANGVNVTIVRINEGQIRQARELYQSGYTLVKIAKEFGVSKTTVRMALKKVGVEMRAAHKRRTVETVL